MLQDCKYCPKEEKYLLYKELRHSRTANIPVKQGPRDREVGTPKEAAPIGL